MTLFVWLIAKAIRQTSPGRAVMCGETSGPVSALHRIAPGSKRYYLIVMILLWNSCPAACSLMK